MTAGNTYEALFARMGRARLDGVRGPRETFVEGERRSAYVTRPDRKAMTLAWKLAATALEKLRDEGTLAFESDQGRRPAQFARPIENEPFLLGVPLFLATVPQDVSLRHELAGATVVEQMAEAAADAFEPDVSGQRREAGLETLKGIVLIEDTLWRRAGEPRMPYACSFAATEWFCRRDETALAGDLVICVQCGSISTARKSRSVASGLRRCSYCSAHPAPHPDNWKKHAIAPAHRGKWWLECQAGTDEGLCSKGYLGRVSGLYCPEHTLRNTTPSRRSQIQVGSHHRYKLA